MTKSYPLQDVRGLTGREARRLHDDADLSTTRDLLGAAPNRGAEQRLARRVDILPDRLREAINRADLMQVPGVGPVTADLFENAGVNSARELAMRNPANLAATVSRYVATRPELGYRDLGPSRVRAAVLAARNGLAPMTLEKAAAQAAEALHAYIDDVLFQDVPESAAFRENLLDWRDPQQRAEFQARAHREVSDFFNVPLVDHHASAGLELARTDAEGFLYAGRLVGLYTEVRIRPDGSLGRVYVEVD